MGKKENLCDTCGATDKDGNPCRHMFQGGNSVDVCTRYENNPKKHAKLAPKAEKKEG
jgi:hypothetical protein